MVMNLTALFIFTALIAVLAHAISRFRSIHLSGALPIAFAALIGIESLLLNLLSLFKAVDRIPLLTLHLVLLATGIVLIIINEKTGILYLFRQYYRKLKRIGCNKTFLFLLPLLITIGFTAWLYPPNNYDTHTYHMSRVAHWIQNHSVSYYQTIIDRQNEMGPGSEYIVLFFQLLTRSDRLANFGQFFALLVLIFSSSYLTRIYRIPRLWAPFIVIISSTAPMAVMQASNPKNDLIAAAMALSIIISLRRVVIGKISKMQTWDYAIAGICIGGGFLVKPTSLLVSAPFVLIGIVIQVGHILKNYNILKKIALGMIITMSFFAVTSGTDIYRKARYSLPRHEVYPLLSEWNTDRFKNPLKMVAQNSPFPQKTKDLLQKMGIRGPIFNQNVFNCQEDVVGNPIQFLAIFLLSSLTILIIPFLLRNRNALRASLLALPPILSWFVFGLVVKDQIWLTRLQLPIFFLLPASFHFLGISVKRSGTPFHIIRTCIIITASYSLAYALFTAGNVPSRPLQLSFFWGEEPSRIPAYYTNSGLKDPHDHLFRTARSNQCSNIGLILGPNSVD